MPYKKNPSVLTLVNPAPAPASKSCVLKSRKKPAKVKTMAKIRRRRNPKGVYTRGAIPAGWPGRSDAPASSTPKSVKAKPHPWRKSVAGRRDAGWYRKGGKRAPAAGWVYFKNPAKKRRKARKARKAPKVVFLRNARKRRVRKSVRRNPVRRVVRRRRRRNPVMKFRRARKASRKAARRNPRKRRYVRRVRRNPAGNVLMLLAVAGGSLLASRALAHVAQTKLAAMSWMPESVRPYVGILTQSVLAAGAVAVAAGTWKKAPAVMKDNAVALAAGTVTALLDSLIQSYASANVSAYLQPQVVRPMAALPVVTTSDAAAQGYGNLDVYEAALRGLNDGWGVSDYVPRSAADYVPRQSMSDYVPRSLSGVEKLRTSNPGGSRSLLANVPESPDDFALGYQVWE